MIEFFREQGRKVQETGLKSPDIFLLVSKELNGILVPQAFQIQN